MIDEKFRFKRTTLRNDFTLVFGGVGKKRFVFVNKQHRPNHHKRTRMQKIRRAAQGWRNKTFGRLTALKMLIRFGKRNPTRKFRV